MSLVSLLDAIALQRAVDVEMVAARVVIVIVGGREQKAGENASVPPPMARE